MNLSPHFTMTELTRSATAQKHAIFNYPVLKFHKKNLKSLAKHVLEPVRLLLGTAIIITSGFRSDALNQLLGGAEDSQHRKGEAADLIPKGMDVLDAAKTIAGSEINFDQLIYEKDAEGKEWIHISHVIDRRKNRNAVLTKIHGQPYVEGLPD